MLSSSLPFTASSVDRRNGILLAALLPTVMISTVMWVSFSTTDMLGCQSCCSFQAASRRFESTPFPPTTLLPKQCRNSLAEYYINKWETDRLSFSKIEPHYSIGPQLCKTMDDQGNINSSHHCNIDHASAHVGYIWKELFSGTSMAEGIGITLGRRSDHNPHFHDVEECYYVTEGTTKTLAQNRFHQFKRGQYLYIPANAIHNTPILWDNFGVIYWFPSAVSPSIQPSGCCQKMFAFLFSIFSPVSSSPRHFKYKWVRDAVLIPGAREAFAIVDCIRMRDLFLPPYKSAEISTVGFQK